MANDLRLSVIMQLADKAGAPLRNISRGSADAARQLRAAREQLKQLNAQQKAVGEFREVRSGLRDTAAQLAAAQQRTATLARELRAAGPPTKAMTREFEAARREASRLGERMQAQQTQAQQLRDRLGAAGLSASRLAEHERGLRQSIATTTADVDRQTAALRRQEGQRHKLQRLQEQHLRAMGSAAAMGGAGAAGIATGRALLRPVGAAVTSYGAQEDASSQLKSAMMLADGSVSAEYRQINELAVRLGDRLPGSTTDFIEMMTMLRRQGLSAQTILNGTGEAAAYLGVQLKMPVTEAAEFAAKMQDATRTTERDMMGLMDMIQRTYYLGVDSGNMLQGFTKMAPVMSIIRKEGLEASRMLAPLLVMMDQTGMRGESAGNAIRKVFQAALDGKKLDKANGMMGPGQKLNFVDGNGQFAGLDVMVAQLGKINGITNQMQRMGVIKALFGDDAETLQVVETLMAKGMDGYREVAAKMQAQADLKQRVDESLKTWANVREAAGGTWDNVKAAIGDTVIGDAKALVEWLGELAGGLRAWVAEHPQLVRWVVRIVAVVGGLIAAVGWLLVSLAAVLAPMLALRFALQWIGVKTGVWSLALKVLVGALKLVFGGLWFIARLMLLNPIGLAITAIATAAFLIYKYWEPIKGFFTRLWDGIVAKVSEVWGKFKELGAMLINGMIEGVTSRLAAMRDAIVGAAGSAIGWFKEKLGIRSPSRVFMAAGQHLGEGAAIGIERSQALVKTAAVGLTAVAMAPLAGASIDARPPLQAAARAPVVQQGDTVQIHINAGPGMDAQAIARAVAAELDRRERARGARQRSALADIH